MVKRYDPSKDEREIIEVLRKEIGKCAKKSFGVKSPKVIFDYENGEEYERARTNLSLRVKIIDEGDKGKERTNIYAWLINNHLHNLTIGQYAATSYCYFTYEKLQQMARKTPIKQGRWVKVKQNHEKPEQNKSVIKPAQKTMKVAKPEPERRKTDYEEYLEEQEARNREFEESLRHSYSGPYRNTANTSDSSYDYDDYDDYLERVAYCRQFEYDFGTKSTVVSDQF